MNDLWIRFFAGIALFFLTLPALAQTRVEYIHTDALGSPVAVTDAAGNIIEREIYEPYGSPITRPPSDQPGFTGHVVDSLTSLTYMQQRYYDSQVGRFLSVDPVTAYDNSINGFNRYRYAMNNPYRFTDPDGRIDWEKLGDSFKIEGSVGITLETKIKLGPVKGSLGLGSGVWGGGATLAPDGYAFQEVAGPSAGIEIGSYGIGRKGSSDRSYQGRNGQLYSEEKVKGGWMFGLKKGELDVEDGGTNAEISGTAGLFLGKLTGSVDLGKAWGALKDSGKREAGGGGGFKGVHRVQGRLDSKRLDRDLKGK